LHHYFEASVDRNPHAIAVVDGTDEISYGELEQQANQLAHMLGDHGIPAGARVGILMHRSWLTYMALLGVLKADAAFVPLDPATPPDRIAYIAENAELDLVLTTSDLEVRTDGLEVEVWALDRLAHELARRPSHRPGARTGGETDPICYIIYTSGSSGRPKGVAVARSSICNFVAVASRVYNVRPDDRVYQGMTISFDFSIEEIWPTFGAGATLIVGPSGFRRLGADLADFLEEHRVNVLYCVPTLLASLPRDVALIRTLVVGGEACQEELVRRWSRPGRRMLNTYGPTEATVTATWSELVPGKPVTIGRAMPTYSIVLLDERLQPVAEGEIGEICIGGPGVAVGYVGLPDKTADRFVEHPLAPSDGDCRGRLYRTGDLGRVGPDGELFYLGRADSEVKVRGHRVDLGEIESLLLEDSGVESAVATLAVVACSEELAAYVVLCRPGDGLNSSEDDVLVRLQERLRQRLPEYMVPSYLDIVTAIPMMASGKVERRRLPVPQRRLRMMTSGKVTPPRTPLEDEIREVWAQTFGVAAQDVPTDADFFADLGGHSMLAATLVSTLREREIGLAPALQDVYTSPTIRSLAKKLDPANTDRASLPPRPDPTLHRSRRVAAAGSAQAVLVYAFLLVGCLPIALIFEAHDGEASSSLSMQLAAVVAAAYLGVRWLIAPVLVRLCAAAVRPGTYPLWGATYIRLWMLDLFLAMTPLSALSGSPLMTAYLRVLGAHVGPGSHVATNAISLPSMIEIGDDVSIGYGVQLRPWLVEDGRVHVDLVRVGECSFVGASAVLEPGADIGPAAAVGRHSTIQRGQRVDAGERWAGSPATRVESLDPVVESMVAAAPPAGGWSRRERVTCLAWLGAFELLVPLAVLAPGALLIWGAYLTHGFSAGLIAAALIGPVFVLAVCTTVAALRKLALPRTPVGIHSIRSPLGARKWVSDKLLEMSLAYTNTLYATLYTVPWLRVLGAEVERGAEVSTAAHLDPDLLVLRENSFVADMASVGSAEFCNGRMALQPTEVGQRAFVGNAAVVPSGTTMGPGSLVGVHSVPPRDVPAGTSWLGSPSIYLPRRQDSGTFDTTLTYRPTRRRRIERLAIELVRITMPSSLIAVALFLCLVAILATAAAANATVTALVAPFLVLLSGAGVVLAVVAVKWCVIGTYRPRVEPLWNRFVRRTELVTGLYEAAAVPALLGGLVGTPFLAPFLRMFGARIGRRTWLGTTYLTEFDLVRVGDDATIGRGVSLQTHLFEDRVMKMSRVHVGDRSSVGDRAIILYDAVIAESAALGTLSLLMKGERLPPATRWCGIPAQAGRNA
jgi:non-ribosomal peptide synthetase-like protein